VLLAIGGAVTLGVLYPNTADKPEQQSAAVEPGQVYREPKTVKLTNADRAIAIQTALRFVNTAVARRHSEVSYDLVAPELRQGMTRDQWRTGEIPVVPFPATEVRVRVDYSYRNELGLRMMLVPPSTSELRPTTFNMDLQAVGSGDKRRWLVSSWTPNAETLTPQLEQESGNAGGASAAGFPKLADDDSEGLGAPLGAAWILVPLGVLGLVLLVPLGLAIRSWRENRRALRDYEATRPLDV
jgi:hypothetical protein